MNMKKAGIYIRVSSERQSEGVSPHAQEADCREYCQSKGYDVVKVYADIEKYRSGKKLVEPSGTRADRPGLKAMLADARAGLFDVLIGWREDRLYRSYRPMLDVLDCIDETGIDIELVKETFDKRIAPVKAWAARMELDAKHDRYMMGIAGRFAKGKAGNHPAPYGYIRDDDGFYQENPAESIWVKRLFEWYAEDVSIREIRRNFITGGAQQRNDDLKYSWNMVMLRRMLNAKLYWTGKHKIDWNGEIYEIPCPIIISSELAQQVQERKALYKYYPAGNTRNNYLAAGLVYCAACDVRANIVSANNGVKKNGEPKKYTFYQCSNRANLDLVTGNHFSRGSAKLIDARIWAKVWALISEPGRFEQALQERIEELQAQEIDAQAECDKLERQLDDLLMERQKVIGWARKGTINENDLETQLITLSIQEGVLKRELDNNRLLVGNRAEKMIELARIFKEQVKAGVEAINAKPETPEQEQLQFEFRKKIVQTIVEKVDIHPDKSVTVHVALDLPEEVCISDPITCHW